jgi:hypothetical protein
MKNSEYIILTHQQWVDAATSVGFDAFEDCTDALEESWGLQMMGFADAEYDSFQFLITDKKKWFLSKIKYGF